MSDIFTNYGILLSYLLLAIATVGAIGFPVLALIKNPKEAKGAMIGLGLVVVIFGISFALSDEINLSKIVISPMTAKLVDTGLYSFYILALLAVAATIYSEITKAFK